MLTLVLYPYVYVLGRSAFLEQSRGSFEAARSLGLSHARAISGSRYRWRARRWPPGRRSR